MQRLAVALALALVTFLLLLPAVALASDGSSPDASSLPLHAAHLGATGLVGLYSWVSASQRAHRLDLDKARDELSSRCSVLEREVAALKEHDRHAPTSGQMSELLGELRGQRAEMTGLRSAIEVMSRRFERYEEHMIAKGA